MSCLDLYCTVVNRLKIFALKNRRKCNKSVYFNCMLFYLSYPPVGKCLNSPSPTPNPPPPPPGTRLLFLYALPVLNHFSSKFDRFKISAQFNICTSKFSICIGSIVSTFFQVIFVYLLIHKRQLLCGILTSFYSL
jgi:hypothetical protein